MWCVNVLAKPTKPDPNDGTQSCVSPCLSSSKHQQALVCKQHARPNKPGAKHACQVNCVQLAAGCGSRFLAHSVTAAIMSEAGEEATNKFYDGCELALYSMLVYPVELGQAAVMSQIFSTPGVHGAIFRSGIEDWIDRTWSRLGIRSLWYGCGLRLFTSLCQRLVYRIGKPYIPTLALDSETNPLTNLITTVLETELALATALIAVYPLVTVRMRLIAQLHRPPDQQKYAGVVDCASQIYADEGTFNNGTYHPCCQEDLLSC